MSMTGFERHGLQLLGYNSRESEFLFLVATHSGYFTTHQFKTFTGTDSGSVCHAFVRKLLDRKHATYHAYRSGERVYHVFARKVYQAIERENLRTRKKHEIEYVKTRLVALDFVLAHREHRYLETESEKIGFFERQYNLDRSVLPVKLYRSRRSADVTPRYFVDRFPMFFGPDFRAAVPTFTYIDSGAVTLSGFITHLRAHRALFESLPEFHFIYVAPSSRLFGAAESAFQRVIGREKSYGQSVSVIEYFRLRRAWDERERMASADVVALKDAQGRYAGVRFDDLYNRWRKAGVSESEIAQSTEQVAKAPRATFQAVVCGSSLKVFADPFAPVAENRPEIGSARSVSEFSGSGSAQVSQG